MADYYKASSEVYDLMIELVGKNHPDLAEVSEEGIALVFRSKASKSAPFGVARKATDLYKALIPDDVEFVIEIPQDAWMDNDSRIREAMLDSLLCACHGDWDEKKGETVYKIVKADIQGFRENFKRYGYWIPEEKDEDEEGGDDDSNIMDMLD